MKINFDQIIDRSGSNSMKWQKYEGTDILPMWVADMDFQTPSEIVHALQKRLEHDIFGYTMVSDELNQTIVDQMAKLYDWPIQPEWIVWLPGVVSGFNIAGRAYGKPTDAIATHTPIYPPFLSAPTNCGRQLIKVPMIEINNRTTLDFDGLETAFQKGVSLFIFCSPHNPCGTLFTKDELEQLVQLCQKYEVILCSDEIHSDFVLDHGDCHIPTASISQVAADLTITLMAPSKTYNIPGLGASFAVIPNSNLRKKFNHHSAGIVPSVNLLGLVATQAAYEHCDDWLKQLIAYLKTNRDIVFNRVNQMKGCKLNPIASTYLAWIDIRKTGIKDPVSFFEQAGIGLSDGAYFGQNGFVRLNFGCPRSILEKGLDLMEEALKQI